MWAFRLEDSPSGHSLQVRARITGLAGFPLLSLTRVGLPGKCSNFCVTTHRKLQTRSYVVTIGCDAEFVNE